MIWLLVSHSLRLESDIAFISLHSRLWRDSGQLREWMDLLISPDDERRHLLSY